MAGNIAELKFSQSPKRLLMVQEIVKQKQMRLPFLVVYISSTLALSVSLSKPNCPEKCGNVTIPYPFGIGSECSAESSFTIICQNSTHPPTPILSSINREVVKIILEGVIIINQPVSPVHCSYNRINLTLPISFDGTPFTVSSAYNNLVILGCQNSVWLQDSIKHTVGQCTATCDAQFNYAVCGNVYCCLIKFPSRLKKFQYAYRSILQHSNSSSCGYVFPVEWTWFEVGYKRLKGLEDNPSNPFDKDFQVAPLVLEWEYDTYSKSISCYDHISPKFGDPYVSTTRYCSCASGYEGNPYLPGGCADIDECRNATLLAQRSCKLGTCVNADGNFHCKHIWKKGDSSAILSPLKIAAIAIGSMIGTLILLYGVWKSRKVMKAINRYKNYNRNGGLLLEQQLASTESGLEKTMLFGSKELAQATEHFNENRILGHGGQGTVYKGMLTDGKIVAVKKSKKLDAGDLEVFINEVVILSQVNHRNIVKLLGCCLETEVPLLVYEFIPNGTLFQHIHEPNEELPLTWEMRVRIATEIAGALSYLHCAASAPIYHRDIKSTNILLDEKYQAKVADFGTSRSIAIDQTHLTTRVIGTFGYLDPEYFQSSQFTEKSDVYSFGVVMVELLTGERAVTSIRAESGRSLATYFLHTMEENHLFDIIDPRVLEEGKREEIMALAELAQRCLHLNGRIRPTMKEIAVDLEGIQRRMKQATLSFQKHDDSIDNPFVEVFDINCLWNSL